MKNIAITTVDVVVVGTAVAVAAVWWFADAADIDCRERGKGKVTA